MKPVTLNQAGLEQAMEAYNKKVVEHDLFSKGWRLHYDSDRIKENRLRLNASDGGNHSNSIYVGYGQIMPLIKALLKMRRDLKKVGVES